MICFPKRSGSKSKSTDSAGSCPARLAVFGAARGLLGGTSISVPGLQARPRGGISLCGLMGECLCCVDQRGAVMSISLAHPTHKARILGAAGSVSGVLALSAMVPPVMHTELVSSLIDGSLTLQEMEALLTQLPHMSQSLQLRLLSQTGRHAEASEVAVKMWKGSLESRGTSLPHSASSSALRESVLSAQRAAVDAGAGDVGVWAQIVDDTSVREAMAEMAKAGDTEGLQKLVTKHGPDRPELSRHGAALISVSATENISDVNERAALLRQVGDQLRGIGLHPEASLLYERSSANQNDLNALCLEWNASLAAKGPPVEVLPPKASASEVKSSTKSGQSLSAEKKAPKGTVKASNKGFVSSGGFGLSLETGPQKKKSVFKKKADSDDDSW